jgi:hypothetical protein
MTVPKDGAVVIPHGSTVVSHEDVNVDVAVMKCDQLERMRYALATAMKTRSTLSKITLLTLAASTDQFTLRRPYAGAVR